MNQEKMHRITFRVEKELRNNFKKIALKNNRSVNSEMIVAMQAYVDANGEGKINTKLSPKSKTL